MTEDARLAHWLGSHRAQLGGASPDEHVDVETLTRHATGQLPAARAHAVSEHLAVCADGRCVAFVRAQAADVDAAADFLYPPPAEGAASPRTFQCKDALWRLFEAAADDTHLPIDELVNEAMIAYARARGYWEGPTQRRREAESALEVTQDARAAEAFGLPRPAAGAPPEDLDESEPSRRRPPSLSPPTLRTPAHTPEAVPRAPAPMPMSAPRAAAVRPAAGAPPPPPSRRVPLPAPPPSARSMPLPPPSRRAPPPLPSASSMPAAPSSMGSASLAKRLVLSFEGHRYDVDKDHFIIGRSKSQADLRIDDSNVSRQHAAIERIGSIHYLVDLGSTNGVYVGDDRVTRRALVDGDEIVITSHRIRCSLA